MNLEKTFKNTVLIFGIIFILYFLKSLMEFTYLALAIINFISLFFLFFFKKAGKILFSITFILLILSGFFFGNPITFDNLDYFLDTMHMMMGSIIFFMLNFTTIKYKFN